MRSLHFISLFVSLLILGGCTIEPPLHLRRAVKMKIDVATPVSEDDLWQPDWKRLWDYEWDTEAFGPVGYPPLKAFRMHVFTLNETGLPKSHSAYSFNGHEGETDVFVGIHDLLFHNIGSEVTLFRSDDELSHVNAYTRIISSGLKTSSLVLTTTQKALATKVEAEEINEQVAYMPDELYAFPDPSYSITDDTSEYDYSDGKYVVRLHEDLPPRSFIWLFRIKFLNNHGRVIGSKGGAALTGVAESVDMQTGMTATQVVSVPAEVRMDNKSNPDMMGVRMLSFGIPGCDPYDAKSVASAPKGKHWFVLNVNFSTGKYKNIRIDVTEQLRSLPTGGVILLEVDVNDFPPEDTDPPVDGGGGFNPLIGDWEEENGNATITY